MRFSVVMTVLLVVITMSLLGIMNSRKNLEFQLTKAVSFESVKNKVSSDVLKEFQSNIAEAKMRLEKTETQIQDLTKEMKAAQEATDWKKDELNKCSSGLSKIKSEVAALDAQVNKSKTEFEQKKDSFKVQVNNLKQELQNQSKVCAYINKTSEEGAKLCGLPPPPKVEQKAEPAKAP